MNAYDLRQVLFDELGYTNSPEIQLFDNIPDIDLVYKVNGIQIAYFSRIDVFEPRRIWQLHRAVWNESKTPLLYIILPNEIRVYNTYALPSKESSDLDTEERLLRHLTQLFNVEVARQKIHSELYQNHYDRVHLETGAFWNSLDGRRIDKHDRADHRLLRAMDALRRKLYQAGLDGDNSYALLGRSIFIRYLEDRGILSYTTDNFRSNNNSREYRKVLHNLNETYLFFESLAHQFGGDLFPVLDGERESVSQKHLNLVADFLDGTDLETGQRSFWPFNFEYIPVELISGIYDTFLNTSDKKTAGTYYTPHTLADFVLDETMPVEKVSSEMKILDPACGSGVFLVRAYQRLVQAWIRENNGLIPDVEKLKNILVNSIYGVDISPTAIRIASFNLYLALIDHLEADTILSTEFEFPSLHKSNLLHGDFFSEAIQENLENLEFDRVIGNPPWISNLSADVSSWLDKYNHEVGNKQLAQAFMLACPRYISSDGEVALLTPAKSTIMVTSGPHVRFREYFFTTFTVRAVFNLSPLRHEIFDSAIHPSAAVFYNANKPELDRKFVYVTPKPTSISQHIGHIVIETNDVKYLSLRRVIEFPHLWKIALWGTPRDESLIERLSKLPTLRDHVENLDFHMAEGIQIGGGDSNEAPWLEGMSLVPTDEVQRYVLDKQTFDKIDSVVFHRPREKRITQGPLALIRQSPINGKCIAAYYEGDIAYRHKITGISGHPELRHILKWIVMVINSPLVQYYHFLTSASWAVERDNVIHREYETMPFIIPKDDDRRFQKAVDIFDEITSRLKTKSLIEQSQVKTELFNLETELTDLIFDIFELYPSDKELIADTIKYSLDFFYWGTKKKRHRINAASVRPPKLDELTAYSETFCEAVNSLLRYENARIVARVYKNGSPLTIVGFEKVDYSASTSIEFIDDSNEIRILLADLDRLLLEQKAPSLYMRRQVRIYDRNLMYLIRPSEARFWSKSQARIDADEVIFEWIQGPEALSIEGRVHG
ncbi:MAG: N-6 DNA methylase [Chloroflexi bacterium]|nr:N-6 DNA methylase [Chloroflexota bacterium]